MEYEPKFTEENEDDEILTFQLEEGLVEDLKDADLTIDQAQEVVYMLEDNAGRVISGNDTYISGGVITVEGEDDAFFQVHYYNPEGDIPTYFIYEATDCDTYLDHILDQTELLDFNKLIELE
jgi:hypothetical protein